METISAANTREQVKATLHLVVLDLSDSNQQYITKQRKHAHFLVVLHCACLPIHKVLHFALQPCCETNMKHSTVTSTNIIVDKTKVPLHTASI